MSETLPEIVGRIKRVIPPFEKEFLLNLEGVTDEETLRRVVGLFTPSRPSQIKGWHIDVLELTPLPPEPEYVHEYP